MRKAPPVLTLLFFTLAIGWLLISLTGSSEDNKLQAENERLYQENLYLRNEINQLHHQLMGIYSAP